MWTEPTNQDDLCVSSKRKLALIRPCESTPDYPHQSRPGKKRCALHQREYRRAMNAWHQAVHAARKAGHEAPEKTYYESRIEYSTPENTLTVITAEAGAEILKARLALTDALSAVGPYVTHQPRPSDAQAALRGLARAAEAARELLGALSRPPSGDEP